MSYGKYGFKNNGGPNIDSFAGRAWNDPWFALGELLAKGYNKNYDERGIRESEKYVLEKLSPAPNTDDMMTALDAVENRYKTEGFNMLGTNDPAQIQAKAENLGQDTPQNRAAYGAGILNNTANFQDDSAFSKFARADIANRSAQIGALKAVGQTPMSQGEALQIAFDKNATAQKAVQKSPEVFDANKYLDQMQIDLRKQGRPQHQIDAALKTAEGKARTMQQDSYEQKVKALSAEIKMLNPASPEYQQKIVEIAKYSPAAANLYGNNVITGKDIWNSDQASKKIREQYDYEQAGADANVVRAKTLATHTAGLRPPANAKIDTTVYDIAMKNIEYEDKLKANNQDYQYSETYHMQKSYVNTFLEEAMFGADKPQPKQEINLNDYEQSVNYFSNYAAKYGKSAAMEVFKDQYGDGNEFTNQIASAAGLAPKAQKPQPVLDKLINDTEKVINEKAKNPERRYGLTYAEWCAKPIEWRMANPWVENPVGGVANMIKNSTAPKYTRIDSLN